MDKAEKKRLKQELRKKEEQSFNQSLPMSKGMFVELFDYIDEKLEQRDCSEKLDITLEFLNNKKIPVNDVLEFLKEYGGYCDCEVIANVEEHFM